MFHGKGKDDKASNMYRKHMSTNEHNHDKVNIRRTLRITDVSATTILQKSIA